MNFKKLSYFLCLSSLFFAISGCNYETCQELFSEVKRTNKEYTNSEDPETRKFLEVGYCMEWDFTPAAIKQIQDDGCVKRKKSYEITGKVLKAKNIPFIGKLFRDKKVGDIGTIKQVFSVATDSNGEFSVPTRVSYGEESEDGKNFPFYPLLSVKTSKNQYVSNKMGYLIPTGFSADSNFNRCPKK